MNTTQTRTYDYEAYETHNVRIYIEPQNVLNIEYKYCIVIVICEFNSFLIITCSKTHTQHLQLQTERRK